MNTHRTASKIISNNERNWIWKWKSNPDEHYFVHALCLKNFSKRKFVPENGGKIIQRFIRWELINSMTCGKKQKIYGFVLVTFFGGGDATAPQWAKASSFTRYLDYTQRRTAVGRTPLDEWSASRKDLYLTTHNTHNKHPCPRWDSNTQPQQASGRRPTPYTARPLGSALSNSTEYTCSITTLIRACVYALSTVQYSPFEMWWHTVTHGRGSEGESGEWSG